MVTHLLHTLLTHRRRHISVRGIVGEHTYSAWIQQGYEEVGFVTPN
jgi:hypothetical protein